MTVMATPQGGWLRGIVKEVPSGDTVVVMAATKAGIAPEKRLILSSLTAPKLGRRDGSTKDEPFAWQSREFLRKLTIGKPCVFRVDYTLEGSGPREFGTVFINDKQNVGLMVAAAGWARVRVGGTQQSPFYEELLKAQSEAEAKGLGLHTKEQSNIAKAVRRVPNEEEGVEGFDSAAFFSGVGKGAVVDAIVEGVNSGSTLRVTLLPEKMPATIMVAGIQCPSLGKRVASKEEGTSQGSNAEGPTPEPFAREARHFAEICCLSRDVKLVVQGISQFGVIVASVQYPSQESGTPATPTQDLASSLVRLGFAKTAEWSLNMMTTGAFKLREAERAAKQKRIGMWHSYVPQQTGSTKLSDVFTGVVVEIVSGDALVVKDHSNGTERRVQLSSVRAPRVATREKAAEPWAAEAKEFLRQRLIGKEVSVKMEYTRKVPASTPQSNAEERVLSFGTVTISEKATGGSTADSDVKVNNVAELLLVRGLGQVTKHKADEERSSHFEDLVNAEEAGKKGKKGIWSNKEAPPAPRANDISIPGTSNRAKQHLPFLQRAGKVTGVVEYVLGGSRLKISIPKEGVVIAFSPAGVRCPGRDEPLAGEAVAFTRLHCMQRDVMVVVENIDKSGTFLGTLVVPNAKHTKQVFDLGIALLEEGLARLQRPWEASPDAVAALEKAQKARKGIWEKEDPAGQGRDEEGEGRAEEGEGEGGDKDLQSNRLLGTSWYAPKDSHSKEHSGSSARKEIMVTDIADANSFYVQFLSQGRMDWITEQLANLDMADKQSSQQGLVQASLKPGDRCIARFSADGQWYRAVVEKVDASDPTARQYDVYFIDYGNRDRVGGMAIRSSIAELNAVPPQAHLANLAFVRAPNLNDDFGVEAAQRLSQLVGGGKRFMATIEGQERVSSISTLTGEGAKGNAHQGQQAITKLALTMYLQDVEGNKGEASSSSDVSALTVNRVLAEEGLVRAVAPKSGAVTLNSDSKLAWEVIKEGEEAARKGHIGLWRYGDPGDDDDDDGGFPALGGSKKTALGNGSNARGR